MDNKQIKLCLLDMDGLMLDTENAVWLEAEKVVLKRHGYNVAPEFLASIAGIGFQKYGPLMRKHVDPNFDDKTIIKELCDYFEDVVTNGVIPKKKGLIELLDYCKQNDIKMAVGTSTYRGDAIKALTNAGIYDYFENIVAGDEVSKTKPYPEVYLKSVEKLKIPKENCVIFEDSHFGCETAFNAGIRLILIPDISYVSDEDKKKAFRVLDDLSQAIDVIKECNNQK